MKRNDSANKITLLNILSTFILQGIAFLTTPIFTRLLGTSQFGVYAVFNSWVLILTCIMGLGIHSAIGTGLYTFRERYLAFRNSILLFSTLVCVIELIIIICLRNILANLLELNDMLILIIGITAFGHYIVNFAHNSFIYEKKAWSNLILSISVSIFTVVLSIILILEMDTELRYLARIYGVTISYVIIGIILWLLLFLEKPETIKSEYYKYGFIVGFPIVFHALSQNILGQSDRVMMQFYGISTSEIGIYSLFYSFCAVLSTILSALNNSWCPFYYDDINEGKWERINQKSKNYIELFTVLSVGFLLLARELSYVMADTTYWMGIDVIPILTLAVYFTFMYQFPVNFEFYHKKTKIIAIGTMGAGVTNIILNAVMIPCWGMYGAAIATALSYLGLFFAHYLIVSKMKEHKYHLKMQVFVPGVIGLLLGVILFYFLSELWVLRWGCGLVIGGFEMYRMYKRKSIF